MPVNPKRVYNMKDKQLVKAFSEIFGCDPEDMHKHLEQGDCPDVRCQQCSVTSLLDQLNHRRGCTLSTIGVVALCQPSAWLHCVNHRRGCTLSTIGVVALCQFASNQPADVPFTRGIRLRRPCVISLSTPSGSSPARQALSLLMKWKPFSARWRR